MERGGESIGSKKECGGWRIGERRGGGGRG